MNFSNLISSDNWTFHYQKTLCVINIYTTPIKVTIQTNRCPPSKSTRSNSASCARLDVSLIQEKLLVPWFGQLLGKYFNLIVFTDSRW